MQSSTNHNEKQNIEVVQTICALLEEMRPEKPAGVAHYRDLITHVADRPGHDVRYAIDAELKGVGLVRYGTEFMPEGKILIRHMKQQQYLDVRAAI